jgi:hypothetical protein
MTMSIPSASDLGIATIDQNIAASLVSPEAIMNYCQSRLSGLDTLIQQKFADQKRRNEDVRVITDFQGQWTQVANGLDGLNPEHMRSMACEIAKLWNRTTDPAIRAKLEYAYQRCVGQKLSDAVVNNQVVIDKVPPMNPDWFKDTNNKMTPEQVQRFGEEIKSLADNASKDNELTMIQMQQIISQRQMAIQLTTQMMANFNDSLKKINENIR